MDADEDRLFATKDRKEHKEKGGILTAKYAKYANKTGVIFCRKRAQGTHGLPPARRAPPRRQFKK
jgi:hypothetical protein